MTMAGCDDTWEGAICGNGFIETPEQCDDGNRDDGDGCSADCRLPTCEGDCCGNGIHESGEGCDDGNREDGDGCNAECQLEACEVDCCGNGNIDPGEQCDDGNLRNGDGCDDHCLLTGCDGDCECAVREDLTELIGTNDLYVGAASDGMDLSSASCGVFEGGGEVYLSFTPDFDGDLVISTTHPTTTTAAVIEVRDAQCDGVVLGCAASSTSMGATLTLAVEAGRTYVAMVEVASDAEGSYTLSLHRAGVCEGLGFVEDVTDELLSGEPFLVDTMESTASMRGSCSARRDANPEALLTFVPPRAGIMVATTAGPSTNFDTLLHIREGDGDASGETYCGSPDAEAVCENDNISWGMGSVIRFDALAETPYSLFIDGGSTNGRGEAAVVVGYEYTSPAVTNLRGCDFETLRDSFAFLVEEGQVLNFFGDTVDAATAADLRLSINNPSGVERHMADDDRSCTFPPPEYTCPEYQFTAPKSGLYSVDVYVGRNERCYDTSLVNYSLTVTADGAPVTLIQMRDD